MKKHIIALFLLCSAVAYRIQAQTEIEGTPMETEAPRRSPAFSFQLNFQGGIPLEEFRDNLDKIGLGGGVLGLANIAQSPISAGLEVSIMGYDSEAANYNLRVGGFLKEYELRTSSNIFLGHALVRIQAPGQRFINPYLDGMIGFKNLFTSTSLTDEDLGESVNSDIDESDWAFSYGGAVGLHINVARKHHIAIDLRCAYLPGNNATYLVRSPEPFGGYNYDDPIEAFEKKSSATLLLLPQIGVIFKFWDKEKTSEKSFESEN